MEHIPEYLSDQVNNTVRNLREAGSPNATVKHVKTLTTQDASKAEICYYTGDKFGNLGHRLHPGQGVDPFHHLVRPRPGLIPASDPCFRRRGDIYEDLTKSPATESRPGKEG